MSIVFTGDEFAEGGEHILDVLKHHGIKASFFLTGNFYANRSHHQLITKIRDAGHYLGAHSDKHLLYCDWTKRDSLLINRIEFERDLEENYKKMRAFKVGKAAAHWFLPPYEWYNDSIASWTKQNALELINFTPGTRSTADYTTPGMKGYRTSEEIFNSIVSFDERKPGALNGFIMLLHIGTDPARTDKFYLRLDKLLKYLLVKKYEPVTISTLLAER